MTTMASQPNFQAKGEKDPSNASVALKQATAEAHRRIEQHPLLVDLMKSGLGPDRYAGVLHGFLSFFRLWEPIAERQAVSSYVPRGLGLAARAALRLDIEECGIALPADPAYPSIPIPCDGPAAFLGALYVVEGSAMGGLAIAAHLGRSHPSYPVRFFTRHGRETVQRWASVRASIDTHLTKADEIETACTSAQRTFEAMESCMDWSLEMTSHA